MCTNVVTRGYVPVVWITLLIVLDTSYGLPLEELAEQWRELELDYVKELQRLTQDDYHGIAYKDDDALLTYLLSKGCSYLAGYV